MFAAHGANEFRDLTDYSGVSSGSWRRLMAFLTVVLIGGGGFPCCSSTTCVRIPFPTQMADQDSIALRARAQTCGAGGCGAHPGACTYFGGARQ